LNNAFKFTNVGSITLNVELSGSEVSIKVIDTGIGIEKDRQNIIWEEFRQASEGLSRNYEGTGLGLSIAKKYTDIMNGRISVESEVGKGTVFTVVFPLIQSITKNPLEPENLEGEKEDGLLIHKKKPSILYVEDDPVAIEYVKYILKKFYNLDVANNSQVALSKVNSFTYSAILMDINLRTGLDGLELTKLIKNIPAYKDIPIIAITAYAMENERKEFLEKGLTHYLSKPFEKNELLSILEKIFTED
jgi:CheY-like chemotaxis protein